MALVQFLNSCEELGSWPRALLQLKMAFIPKVLLRPPFWTRSIAVSSTIYRAWSRLQLRALADHLGLALPHWQAGGVRNLDPEVMLLASEVDFSPASFPHAAALDYRKAFDSCDFTIALAAKVYRFLTGSSFCCRTNGLAKSAGLRSQESPPRECLGTAQVYPKEILSRRLP